MVKNNELEGLVALSRKIGKEVAYVQGGGGNTSVKLSNGKMAIKSSGTCLKEMSQFYGYTFVDFKKLNEFILNLSKAENNFTQKINSFADKNYLRPSIETGFHSILGKYVIHTHSVFVNILTCAKEGESIIKDLFPDYFWVNYATPGLDLMIEILDKVESPIDKSGVIFLQNHGLIVWADKLDQAFKIHHEISNLIIKKFNLTSFKFDSNYKYSPNKNKNEVIFPDQAVYTMAGEEILLSSSAQEILCSYNYILEGINESGLTPLFLDESEAIKLLNMESEKYRQGLISK